MMGTVAQSNWLARIGATFAEVDRAFKATPTPAQLYPPRQDVSTGLISFPGWEQLEQRQGNQDEQRIRIALQSTSVFSNMQAVANEVSSAELAIKERKSRALEEVENHPLKELWEAPNPHMGRSFLMSFWAWSYTLAGKAYLYWLPARGEIQELWPIPPFMINPVPATKDFIGGYAFRSGPTTDPIIIPPEFITYSHSVNLFDIRDGLSFLAAAMVAINSEIAEMLWNQNFFSEDNAVPAGLITVPRDTLDSDLARVRQEIRDFFGGTRRGVAVARAGDMDYKAFIRSQKDVEFAEGIRLASEQIDRAMGFPKGYWSERANRANAQQARDTMIAGAVWPLLVRLAEDMNAQQVRRLYGEQYRAEFKDIRPEDRELKLREQEARKSHWTIDELRKADGKDPIGDVRGGMLIAELAKGMPTPASLPSQETEAYVAEQEAALALEEEAAPMDEGMDAAESVDDGAMPEEEAPMKGLSINDIPEQYRAGVGERLRQINTLTPEQEQAMREVGIEGAQAGTRFRDALVGDLARWERKALKSLKRFKTADVRFESAAIPADEQERIRGALEQAHTQEAVKAAFKGQDVISGEWDAAVDWAKQVVE